MKNRILKFLRSPARAFKSKEGQTLVEYALILALVTVTAIAVLIKLGSNLGSLYSKIDSSLVSSQFH